MRIRTMRKFVLAALVLVISASRASASEFYYVLVFGSQSSPKQLRYTHSWATFVKADGQGTDPNNYALTAHTISWLPKTLKIRVWTLHPEPGVDLSLHGTLRTVYATNQNVVMWGPFLVRKEVYESSLRVYDRLNSGRIQYKAIDGVRTKMVHDCVHAVTAVDPILGEDRAPLIRVGIPASRFIARQVVLRSAFDQSANDNSWLIPRLGLRGYPIAYVPAATIPRIGCTLCVLPD